MKKRAFAATAAALLLFVPQAASADPILLDQWYSFGFGDVGSSLGSGAFVIGTNPASILAPDANWTFSLAQAGSLLVIDGFNSGDQFQISNFGISIGITSAPTGGQDCSNDITACLNNAGMSQGTFGLAAGNHSLGGTAIESPFGGGTGFFRVNSVAPVPEPSSWAMMLVGFGAAGVALRRRRRPALLRQTA